MAYAQSMRKAIETLRRKIFGANAQISLLYNKNSTNNSLQPIATLSSHFFVSQATDPETGEQFHKLEFYAPSLTAGQIRSIGAVEFNGVKYGTKAFETVVDSSGIRSYKLGPL